VDNLILKTSQDKMKLIHKLKNLKDYKAQPLKEVSISNLNLNNVQNLKNQNKNILLIPTIFDRAVQVL